MTLVGAELGLSIGNFCRILSINIVRAVVTTLVPLNGTQDHAYHSKGQGYLEIFSFSGTPPSFLVCSLLKDNIAFGLSQDISNYMSSISNIAKPKAMMNNTI